MSGRGIGNYYLKMDAGGFSTLFSPIEFAKVAQRDQNSAESEVIRLNKYTLTAAFKWIPSKDELTTADNAKLRTLLSFASGSDRQGSDGAQRSIPEVGSIGVCSQGKLQLWVGDKQIYPQMYLGVDLPCEDSSGTFATKDAPQVSPVAGRYRLVFKCSGLVVRRHPSLSSEKIGEVTKEGKFDDGTIDVDAVSPCGGWLHLDKSSREKLRGSKYYSHACESEGWIARMTPTEEAYDIAESNQGNSRSISSELDAGKFHSSAVTLSDLPREGHGEPGSDEYNQLMAEKFKNPGDEPDEDLLPLQEMPEEVSNILVKAGLEEQWAETMQWAPVPYITTGEPLVMQVDDTSTGTAEKSILLSSKEWHLMTLVVDNDQGTINVVVNGETVISAYLQKSFYHNGPFSIALGRITESKAHEVLSQGGAAEGQPKAHSFTVDGTGIVLFGVPKEHQTSASIRRMHGGCARFVKIEQKVLNISEILTRQVPHGVWLCSSRQCKARNSPDARICVICRTKRNKSGTRPAGDMDPRNDGLMILVRDSFDELVVKKSSKHYFVMKTADWCGPSKAMYPHLYRLANVSAAPDATMHPSSPICGLELSFFI